MNPCAQPQNWQYAPVQYRGIANTTSAAASPVASTSAGNLSGLIALGALFLFFVAVSD